MDKRIEDKVDSKLGPVMDRLSALEKTGTSSLVVQRVVLLHHLTELQDALRNL